MKRILLLIDLCLLTTVAYLAISVFYFSFETDTKAARTPGVENSSHTNHDSKAAPSLSDYKIILDRNIFKTQMSIKNTPKRIDLEKLEQTGLELLLLGTVVSEKTLSYAVLQQKNKKDQRLYKEGDAVFDAILKLVLKDKIVLRVDGKDEILKMAKKNPVQKRIERIKKKRRSRPDPEGVSKQEIVLSRNEIEGAIRNVNELMTQAQISPHFTEGKTGPGGLSISSIKNGSIFRRMGLRDGDVITGVDGRQIESLDDALTLYQQLKISDNVSLQLLRRGRAVDLDYAIE